MVDTSWKLRVSVTIRDVFTTEQNPFQAERHGLASCGKGWLCFAWGPKVWNSKEMGRVNIIARHWTHVMQDKRSCGIPKISYRNQVSESFGLEIEGYFQTPGIFHLNRSNVMLLGHKTRGTIKRGSTLGKDTVHAPWQCGLSENLFVTMSQLLLPLFCILI